MSFMTEKMVVVVLPKSVASELEQGRVSGKNREVLVRACQAAVWRDHEWRAIEDYDVECWRCSAAPASLEAAFSCGTEIPEQTTTGEKPC